MPQDDFNKKDPWGRGSKNDGPPDLTELLKKIFNRKPGSGGTPSVSFNFNIIGIAVGVLVLAWGLLGIFFVQPAEQAVITRFGRLAGIVGPGPHWVPRLIEAETLVNVQQVSNFKYQSEMLTEDENIVSVAVAVQYRIAKPGDFLFNVIEPIETLRQATSSALRQVVGQMTLNDILTTGREKLREAVAAQLNDIMTPYKSGVSITDVALQPAKPPEEVIHAFDDAIKAREDEQTYINQAEAYQRQELSIVKGKVSRIMQQAKAYKQQVVLQAQGAVSRYLALLKPYKMAPVVTRDRLYLGTLQNVLSKTTNVLIDSNKGNNVLYLPLDQIIKQQHAKLSSLPSLNKQAVEGRGNVSNQTNASADTSSAYSSYGNQRPTYSQEGQ